MPNARMSFCLAGILFVLGPARGQDYGFEIPKPEERSLELNGSLDGKWGLLRPRAGSPFRQFQNLPSTADHYLSQYRLDFYLNGDYRLEGLGFFVKTLTQYVRQEPATPELFELYGSLSLSPQLRMSLGKRRHSWGKGYAFNPAGYVNAEKDPENPDLSLAGRSALDMEYNRSFSGPNLQNLSLNSLLLIPEAEADTRFAAARRTGIVLKLYVLVRDVDVDVMTFYQKGRARRYGADFAANLLTNLELHGELDYAVGQDTYLIEHDRPAQRRTSGLSHLLGVRYLTGTNTTLVAELYHRDNGMNEQDFDDYVAYVRDGVTTDDTPEAEADRAMVNDLVRSKNLMRDYAYAKVTHPEPFSLLYSSVSAVLICNLQDRSCVVSPQFLCRPFTDVEVLFWPSFLLGNPGTEYGSRAFRRRLEFWMRFFFG